MGNDSTIIRTIDNVYMWPQLKSQLTVIVPYFVVESNLEEMTSCGAQQLFIRAANSFEMRTTRLLDKVRECK